MFSWFSRIGGLLLAIGAGVAGILVVRQQGAKDERKNQELETARARERIQNAERAAPRDRPGRVDRMRDGSA